MKSQSHPSSAGSEQRLLVRLLTISLVASSPIIAAALSGTGIWLFRAAILFGLALGIALLVYLTLPSDANGVGSLRLGHRRRAIPSPCESSVPF